MSGETKHTRRTMRAPDGMCNHCTGAYAGSITVKLCPLHKAAPALYEALREAVEAIQDELSASGPDEVKQHPILKAHQRTARKARAALALVEGTNTVGTAKVVE